MKKLLVILVLLLTLCGCGSNGPKSVVTSELKSIDQNLLDETLATMETGELSTEEYAYFKEFYKLLLSFDYSVDSVEENEDLATVYLTIKTFDLSSIFNELDNKEENAALIAELSNNYTLEKEKELMASYASQIEKIIQSGKKTVEYNLEVPCIKKDGNWVIDPSYDLADEIAMSAALTLMSVTNVEGY